MLSQQFRELISKVLIPSIQDPTEMSLIAGEVIDVVSTIPNDPDYVQAERGHHQTGKIPSSYLEFLD